ncbi:GNAT family N-acetyltransferase [Falsihalocynthiibacter sp. SS001]|uniref:GNAT family N-acetyltransferase n=1 Tax=Falsihalocynthiibacter sp. SS001 TaxID=3349698 RepID=UPI0036D36D90
MSKDTLQIRAATSADVNFTRVCAEQAYAPYIASIGKRPAPLDADYAALISRGTVYIAQTASGAPLGFIVCFPRDGQMHVENIAVLPAAAGQGVGRQLFSFCERAARKYGLSTLDLYTNVKMTDNLSLYPYLGFHEVGRRTEDGFERVYFEKHLPQTSE